MYINILTKPFRLNKNSEDPKRLNIATVRKSVIAKSSFEATSLSPFFTRSLKATEREVRIAKRPITPLVQKAVAIRVRIKSTRVILSMFLKIKLSAQKSANFELCTRAKKSFFASTM